MGRWRDAMETLEALLRQPDQADRDEARKKLAELLVKSDRGADALPHLQHLVKQWQDESGQIDPKRVDSQVLIYLGIAQLRLGNDRDALKTFRSTVELAPRELDAYRYAAALLRSDLKQGRSVEKPDGTKPKPKTEKKSGREELEAEASAALADAYMKKLIENNPKLADAYISRGQYILEVAQHEQQRGLTIKHRKEVEDDARKRSQGDSLRYAQLLNENVKKLWRGYAEQALEQMQKAVELEPENVGALLGAARSSLYLAHMQEDEASRKRISQQAAEFTRKAVEADRSGAEGYRLMYNVKLAMNQNKEAIDVLWDGVAATDKNSPGHITLLLDLGDILADLGKDRIPEIHKVIEELQSIKDANLRAREVFLQARCALMQQHWTEARGLFEAVRPDLVASVRSGDTIRAARRLALTDVWIGDCYGQEGNAERQLEAYRRATDVDPTFADAHLRLTSIMANQGQWHDAVDEFQKALKMRSSPELLLGFARLLVARNQQRGVVTQWDDIEKVIKEAEQQIEQRGKSSGQSPDAQKADEAMKAEIAALRWNILRIRTPAADLEPRIRGQLQENPKNLQLWLDLILLAAQQEKWEAAQKCLLDAEKACGDSMPLRLARADYLVRRFGSDAVPDVAKLIEKVDAFSDAEREQLVFGLIGAFRRANSLGTAKGLTRQLAERRPGALGLRRLLLELTLDAPDSREPDKWLAEVDKVIEDIEQALKVAERKGDRDALRLCGQAVRLYVQAKDNNPALLEQALRDLETAQKLRPDWAFLPRLAGDIYALRLGRREPALEQYRRVMELGDSNMLVVGRLTELLYDAKRYRELDRLLQRLVEQKIALTPHLVRMHAAAILLAEGWRAEDYDRVETMILKSDDKTSKDYRDALIRARHLLDLALRARAAKQEKYQALFLKEAEKSCRDAVQRKPTAAECWVGLVQFLQAAGQPEKAREEIERARQAGIQDAALNLARMYEIVGERARAEEEYLRAEKANPALARHVGEFYFRLHKPQLGKPYLDKILKGEVKAPPEDTIWARRAAAVLLLEGGDHSHVAQALARINENLQADPNSLPDLRIKAQLLLRDPRRSKSEEAVDTYLRMGEQKTPDDWFELAQIYLALGKWTDYRKAWQRVMAGKPEPRQLAAHVSALLRHNERGDLSEAQNFLPRIEEAMPDQPITIGLHATLLYRQNKIAEVIDYVNGYIEAKTKEVEAARSQEARGKALDERLDRMRIAAGVLDQFAAMLTEPRRKAEATKLLQRAEALYRFCADPAPHESKRMAELEARAKSGALSNDEKQELATLKRKMAMRAIALADFLAKQKHCGEALDLLERHGAEAGPEAVAQIAMRIFRLGKPNEVLRAEKLVSAGLKQPDRPLPLVNAMAEYCTVQQRHAEADQFYREILAKDADNFVALNNLGVLLALQVKNLDEALEKVEKAIKIAGPMAAILDSRAVVYIARRESDKALADLQAALQDEATPVRLFHQAQAYHIADRNDEARASLEEAMKTLKIEMLDPPERPLLKKLCDDLGVAAPRE
jgi:Tfp pilus assembly protein PilF